MQTLKNIFEKLNDKHKIFLSKQSINAPMKTLKTNDN